MAVNGDAFSMSAFTGHTNWVEFCEHHASLAAEEFSLHVAQFLHDNVASDRQLTRRDFLNKFIDCFQRHFDSTQVCTASLHNYYIICHAGIVQPYQNDNLAVQSWTVHLGHSV